MFVCLVFLTHRHPSTKTSCRCELDKPSREAPQCLLASLCSLLGSRSVRTTDQSDLNTNIYVLYYYYYRLMMGISVHNKLTRVLSLNSA